VRRPITAALLVNPGDPLKIADVLIDEPADREVLVRTEQAGLCHSDLHYLTGSLSISTPTVLGHEVVGTVEQTGPAVTRFVPGDRVVATVTPACGACPLCLRGRPTQCSRVEAMRARTRPRLIMPDGDEVGVLGGIGAFGAAFLATEQSLAAVPADVPPAIACLLGCCITTGVGAIVHGAKITPEDTVAVIGCGGVGIAAIQGARIAGARVIVAIDTAAAKLDLARSFGATDTVLAGADPQVTADQVRKVVNGGVTHAIEAVGRRQTAELAFDLLAPTGTATILGLLPEGERISLPADALIYGDRVIQGAYMGANRFLSDIGILIDHYRSGRLDLDAMVTARIPFSRINEGFAAMADPKTIRVVVDLGQDGT